MKVNTVSGRPPRIDRVYFRARYGQNFPSLLDDDKDDFLDGCIESVYTLFAGVVDIWRHLERNLYCDKTQMCYGLLTAWYITDIAPEYAEGVLSSGGVPVRSKRIGGTQVTFAENNVRLGAQNNADLLSSLKSNAFGAKAYLMIKASGKLNFLLDF